MDAVKYKSVPIPSLDQPTPQQAKALAKCSSMNLYYGLGAPADPVRARLCAYTELGEKRANDDYFLGADTLMMVYANGRGVARNLDLALRFACEGNTMPDSGSRVQHLVELKPKNSKEPDFDVCEDLPRSVMEHWLV